MRAIVAVMLAAVVAAGTFGLGWWGGAAESDAAAIPTEGSADAGFLRDMIVHHDQAVAMSFSIRDRSNDNLLDAIATDIILNQLIQIGMMRGYLNVSELPPSAPAGGDPPMAWMGHPTDGLMPGMATPAELVSLRDLTVTEAEVLFFRLMIRHHASGIKMAQAGLQLLESPHTRELAETIIPLQAYEIELMQQELLFRGEAPEPTLDAAAMGSVGGGDMGGMAGHDMGTPTGTPVP